MNKSFDMDPAEEYFNQLKNIQPAFSSDDLWEKVELGCHLAVIQQQRTKRMIVSAFLMIMVLNIWLLTQKKETRHEQDLSSAFSQFITHHQLYE
jgi:hypothetical protein